MSRQSSRESLNAQDVVNMSNQSTFHLSSKKSNDDCPQTQLNLRVASKQIMDKSTLSSSSTTTPSTMKLVEEMENNETHAVSSATMDYRTDSSEYSEYSSNSSNEKDPMISQSEKNLSGNNHHHHHHTESYQPYIPTLESNLKSNQAIVDYNNDENSMFVSHSQTKTRLVPVSIKTATSMYRWIPKKLARYFYTRTKKRTKRRLTKTSKTSRTTNWNNVTSRTTVLAETSSNYLLARFLLPLRKIRLPLLFFCFLFFFVIQFRANSPINGNGNETQRSSMGQQRIELSKSALASHQSSALSSLSSSSLIFSSLHHAPTSFSVMSNGTNNNTRSLNTNQQSKPNNITNNVLTTAIQSSSSIVIESQNVNFIEPQYGSNTSITDQQLPPCPLIPPKLVGRLKVLQNPPPMNELETSLPNIEVGGRYRPKECQPKYRVAIIVPYRDREEHLRTFLMNMHPMLMRQNIDYGIYIIAQSGTDRFNRAKLFNVGYLEALKHYQYDCFVFHDVDLIPEDDHNLYTCPEQPRHMSVAVDKFRYRLPYVDLFGGVSALTKTQMQNINGFSNEFWGWGGEDDDISNRIRHYGYNITRYSADIARYTMLKHKQDSPNADRYKKLYNGWRRYKSDGINSTKYQVIDTIYKKLYTLVLVDLFPPPSAKQSKSRRHLYATLNRTKYPWAASDAKTSRLFGHRNFLHHYRSG